MKKIVTLVLVFAAPSLQMYLSYSLHKSAVWLYIREDRGY
jgi:hypothetical protein